VASKVIRNITKVFRATSGRLFGRVSAGTGRGEELTPTQVRSLLSVSTTAETASLLAAKADLVGGVIPTAQIPAVAITQYLGSVASQAAMLLLDGDRGDWCLRSDLGTTWVLADDDSTLLTSWIQLNYPTAPVTSVAGRTGAVTLSTSDVSGLGTLATQSGTFSGTSSGTNTGDQNLFSTIAVSGQSDVVADQSSDTLTLVAGTNISITTNAATDTITITNTAAGLSGTGSIDNAVLRADGAGGATLQSSAIVIDDLYTASPNNTVNYVCLKPTGGTTNVGVAVMPKGTGAFSLAVPDGTTTGGNARGANAVDLQTSRTNAANVASGSGAFVCGVNNRASGSYSASGGINSIASAVNGFAWGFQCTASGGYETFAFGEYCTASADNAVAFGHQIDATGFAALSTGSRSAATRYAQRSHAAGYFGARGDAQSVYLQARNTTTSAVATELFLDGLSARLTISSGKILSALVRVTGVKSDGSEIIKFLRDVTIKNVGGTTSLETSPVTIGTDINVSAATLDLSADNTNDTLKIAVTPPAGTWRWHAIVECANEIAYGT
jgi:hypothetical protein